MAGINRGDSKKASQMPEANHGDSFLASEMLFADWIDSSEASEMPFVHRGSSKSNRPRRCRSRMTRAGFVFLLVASCATPTTASAPPPHQSVETEAPPPLTS